MPLIRYPGSKAKLASAIIDRCPDAFIVPLYMEQDVHFVEPFFGSGAIGIEIMKHMHREARVTFSDADIGIACLWKSVWKKPEELINRIRQFTPNVESFYEYKEDDGAFTDTVDTGFRKLALHRISVSGFGAMAGGPIGGRRQLGDYSVDSRWRPERLAKSVASLHDLFRRFPRLTIEHTSVFDTLRIAASSKEKTFAYLDPPYYEKGDQLYAVKFTESDHKALSEVLHSAEYCWALSYDDHERIRRLYPTNRIERLEVRYTNAVTSEPKRRKNHEIIIISEKLDQLVHKDCQAGSPVEEAEDPLPCGL